MSIPANSTHANETTSYYATTAQLPAAEFVSGMIMLWNAVIAPPGWNICDGTNGTPNLINRFVVNAGGAGSSYLLGDTGGSGSVSLRVGNLPDHTHGGCGLSTVGGASSGTPDANYAATTSNTTGITSPGFTPPGGESFDVRPPYYALTYIMKL